MGPLAPLGINLTFLISQVVNFILLLLVLRLWAWKPILSMLEKRKQTIAQGLEDARVAAEARANAERDAEQVVLKAQQEANEVVRQAQTRADEVAREVKAVAEKEAAEIRTGAGAEAELIKSQALAELRGQVAALSIAAAEKLVREALDEKRQRTLIAEFFSGLKAGKLAILEGERLSGSSAEVTSALPLTAEEQESIRKDLGGKIGAASTISFRVEPRLLGGLVVSVGERVLDGSVAGSLESLRRGLK